jgi:hypothetical protein
MLLELQFFENVILNNQFSTILIKIALFTYEIAIPSIPIKKKKKKITLKQNKQINYINISMVDGRLGIYFLCT